MWILSFHLRPSISSCLLSSSFILFTCIKLCKQLSSPPQVESSWNVMVHGDTREQKWRVNWRMQWVASTLHTTSEHVVSSITTADAHTSAASSRLNWRLRLYKWTRPFRRKTKSRFYACAITFQTQPTTFFPLLSSISSLCYCLYAGTDCPLQLTVSFFYGCNIPLSIKFSHILHLHY